MKTRRIIELENEISKIEVVNFQQDQLRNECLNFKNKKDLKPVLSQYLKRTVELCEQRIEINSKSIVHFKELIDIEQKQLNKFVLKTVEAYMNMSDNDNTKEFCSEILQVNNLQDETKEN